MRKNLAPTEAVAIGRALEEREQEKARKRQLIHLKQGNEAPVREIFPNGEAGRTRDAVGKMIGMSGRTYEKARAVVEAAEREPEQFGDLAEEMDRTGKVHRTFRKLKEKQREKTHPMAPPVQYPLLIVASAEHMPQIPDESIDLIITSPPYNLGNDHWPMGGEGREPRKAGIGYYSGDSRPEPEYQSWQIAVLHELYRVARNGASLFYNHKVRNHKGHIIHPITWLSKGPWIIRQEIVWDRGSTHNHCPSLFWPEDERIYWMTKGAPTLPNRPIGMSSVWRFHGPVADTWHPAPFAVELPHRCLQAVGRPGITVLDPFAGSCTTIKMALECGYSAIGVDIVAEYLERARRENGWIVTNKS